jgi:xanthine/uracil/vitamin C permease (AzgA family)
MHPGVLIASALAGVFGIAIVAVLVSRNARTGSVISTTVTALAGVISAATAPVTGSSSVGNNLGNSVGPIVSNFNNDIMGIGPST